MLVRAVLAVLQPLLLLPAQPFVSLEGKKESAGTQEHIFPALLPGGKKLLVLMWTPTERGWGLPVPPWAARSRPALSFNVLRVSVLWGKLNCRRLLAGKWPVTPLRGVKNKNSDFWCREDGDALGSSDSCL